MDDLRKTKSELIEEINQLRDRVSKLEKAEKKTKRKGKIEDAKDDDKKVKISTSGILKERATSWKFENFEEVAREIFNFCKQLTGAQIGYISLLSPGKNQNETVFLACGDSTCSIESALPMHILQSFFESVLKEGKVVFENKFDTKKWKELLKDGHIKIRNLLCAPIKVEGNVVGLLVLAEKPGGFGDEDCRLASTFSELSAIYLQQCKIIDLISKDKIQFCSIAETASEAILSLDIEGNITFWNKAATKIFGYSKQEILGKSMDILFSEKSRDIIHRVTFDILKNKLKDKSKSSFEIVVRKSDGTEMPVEFSISEVEGEKGKFFTVIMRDISDRQKTIDKLVKYQQRLEGIINKKARELRQSYEVQMIINSILKLSFENTNISEILKHALRYILGLRWLEIELKGAIFLYDDLSKKLILKASEGFGQSERICSAVPIGKCICGRAALNRRVVFSSSFNELHEIKGEGCKHHGHYCIPLVSGKRLLGVICLFLQPEHKEEIKEEEILMLIANTLAKVLICVEEERMRILTQRKYTYLIRNLPGGIIVLDKDGYIQFFNENLAETFGKKPEDFINKHFTEFGYLCGDLISKGVEDFNSLIKDGIPIVREYKVKINENKVLYYEANPSLIKGENGDIRGVQIFMKDITRHKLEDEKMLKMIKMKASPKEKLSELDGMEPKEKLKEIINEMDLMLKDIIEYGKGAIECLEEKSAQYKKLKKLNDAFKKSAEAMKKMAE